jgi:hypothetical protein
VKLRGSFFSFVRVVRVVRGKISHSLTLYRNKPERTHAKKRHEAQGHKGINFPAYLKFSRKSAGFLPAAVSIIFFSTSLFIS